MKPIVYATAVSLALIGASGAAFAAWPGSTSYGAPASTSYGAPASTSYGATGAALAKPPIGSGKIYTEALNILSAKGYHGMNLISQKGMIVHATAMTRTNKQVSVRVDTATGTVQSS
ncbi:MAG: hypothetical protein M0002_08535 [Rhodospirillales bacterium]|nr:hypothetical protein [Rhodospirillales bacterium]